jgi:serine/threonine-protein kinase
VSNLAPGTLLGAYLVEGTIGAGSMGEVFRGIDTGLNRKVAIKILSEKHKDSNELRARFVREGRAVAAISHPNVVQVFATGNFDERPYIAMELLDGTDLGSIVDKGGPLDSTAAAHAVLDAASGLAAAAKAGLIHRDVKPSNLVRLVDGKVKVTDFGLAKPVDPGSEPALTAMGVVVGTPDYIAPEQARGEAIDERVDIYALGGTLYFLLTGIPPFRTGKPAEDKYLKVVARHLRNPAPDAKTVRPEVDGELAELARLMMAKKPAERPSYADLIARVSAILARLDPGSVPDLILTSRERSRPIVLPPLDGPAPAGGAALARPAPAPGRAAAPGRPGRAPTRPDDDLGGATISDGDLPVRRGVPGWAWAVTILSVAVFVTGLALFLARRNRVDAAPPGNPTGPAPGAVGSGSASAGGGAPGASPGTTLGTAPGAAPGTAPATAAGTTMLQVHHPDGTRWFQVDAYPVSAGAYRQVFGGHTQPAPASGKPDDAPVTNVSYNEARSYAHTRGARLLRSDEWDAASTTAGFMVSDGILEWVDSDGAKKTVRQHGKNLTRPDKEQPDVTFRLAKDP